MYLVPPCGFVHREQVARAEASVQAEKIIAEKKKNGEKKKKN